MKLLVRFSTFSVVFLFTMAAAAQMTVSQKKETIDSVTRVLRTKYVIPDVAEKMAEYIQQQLKAGKYDTVTTGDEFAFVITRDLHAISKDLHLKLTYEPKQSASPATELSNDGYKSWAARITKENNYGITAKQILPGNIGYIDVRMFGALDLCADTIAAAMKFIENTAALIIDVRSCRGSIDENTIPFFCGYFFDESVQLSDFFDREKNFTKQFWSAAWVPGKKYLNKPVYIVTGGRTFSGGEAFAYDMQQLKRATLIGEVTRGGAHPTQPYRATASFNISVPYAQTINPVTHTNWEVVGVKPDSSVKANRAVYAAHHRALEYLIRSTDNADTRTALEKKLQQLVQNAPQFRTVQFSLEGYENAKEVAVAGSFNFYARKSLLLQRKGNAWVGEAEVEPGEISYAFIVDGKWMRDPKNEAVVQVNGASNSLMVVK